MKRILLPIGILVVCIIFAGILVRSPTEVKEASPEIILVAVRVIESQLESVQLTVESHGEVQTAQPASISAAVAGPICCLSPALSSACSVALREPSVHLLSH